MLAYDNGKRELETVFSESNTRRLIPLISIAQGKAL